MNCLYMNRKFDPDSAWRAQNKEVKENPMYSLMDISMGGSLVRAFEHEGHAGVEALCKKEMEMYLYNHGQGDVIRKDDYVQWLNRGLHQSTTQSHDGAIGRTAAATGKLFMGDHEACWDLNLRGAVGETVLHLCYLNDSPIHTEIARTLLNLYPKLSLDFYEGEEYYGESALHLAIVYGDLDSVKLLVEKGANINQRATGNFFLPEDQKAKRSKYTNYDGYAYYGEYPLAFAASFGHESIYDFLIKRGADPNVQDSFGNTVLHMLIINNQSDMYSYAARHPIKPANTWIKNGPTNEKGEGLTPLALASKLGRHEIFNEIMELHRIELYRFSNINCSLYPLHAVDTIGLGGHTNWNSALMIIVNGETDNHLEMLQGGVIRQLLDEKWKTFVRKQFFILLLILVVHLVFLSAAIYLRPDHDLMYYTEPKDGVRFMCELIVVLGCCFNFFLHFEEFKTLGIYLFLSNLKNAPSKPIFLISCLLVLTCVPIRLAQLTSNTAQQEVLHRIEDSLLIIAVPCAWTMLLFFAKGHGLTGTSVMMFFKIIIGDLFRFTLIYMIFLLGFAQAFYFLFKDIEDSSIETFKTPHGTVMSLIHMTLGEFNYEQFDDTHYPELTMLVFAVFMLLMPILLLNMLIAMMGNTYMNVIQKSEKEWVRQWAKIVIVLERAFSKKKLLKYQAEYSVPVDSPPKADAEYLKRETKGEHVEYHALMVIKASSKTRAKQRTGAIHNWKWMLREVVTMIKDMKSHGFTGEISYRAVFPEMREFSAYEQALNRSKHSHWHPGGGTRRSIHMNNISERVGAESPAGHDILLSSAVEQLVWEQNLDVRASSPDTDLTVLEGESAEKIAAYYNKELSAIMDETGGQ